MKEKRKSFVNAVKVLLGKKKKQDNYYQECQNKVELNKTYSLPVNVSLSDSSIYDLKHEKLQRKGSTLQYFASPSKVHECSTHLHQTKHNPNDGKRQDIEDTQKYAKLKYHSVKARERNSKAEIVKSHHQNQIHSSSSRKFSIKRFKGRKDHLKVNQSLPNLSENLNCMIETVGNESVDTIDFATKEMFKHQTDCDNDFIELSFE